jgi:hypothetical protein
MASYPILIVGDGVIELSEELRADPHFKKGTRLELVSSTDSAIVFRPQIAETGVTPISSDDWRSLEGILADDGIDTTEWKKQEREWELAHDERKFGTARPQWPDASR